MSHLYLTLLLGYKINPSLVLVQPRKTRPFITERLLMGCKESNQAKGSTECLDPNCFDIDSDPEILGAQWFSGRVLD